MRRKKARSIGDIYRKERQKLRKRLAKIKDKLEKGTLPEQQTQLVREQERLQNELKTVIAMSRMNVRFEQKNTKKQQEAIQGSHKQSGFNRINARFISGGLPTLGKRR